MHELTNADDISPALRASYQAEMDAMLEPKLTARRALPGIGLLLILLVCVAGIVRNMFVYSVGPLVLVSWMVLAVAFSAAAYFIIRDFGAASTRRSPHSRSATSSCSRPARSPWPRY